LTLRPTSSRRLGEEPEDGFDEYAATPIVGITAGQWDTLATGMGYPLDQGPDDLLSLTYESEPFEEPLEVGGSPEAHLDVERVDLEGPFDLVVKLVDVTPDGRAELVATGWARTDGRPTNVSLCATAWALGRGHRLRLSVACADFPRVWPDSRNPRLRLHRRDSAVRIPIVPKGIGRPIEVPRPLPVAPAERAPWSSGGTSSWTTEHDVANNGLAVTLASSSTVRLPEGGTLEIRQHSTARVEEPHPEGATVEGTTTIVIEFPGSERVEVEARSRAWRTRSLYHGRVAVDGRQMLDRSWRNF
jgi:hypothetical protein